MNPPTSPWQKTQPPMSERSQEEGNGGARRRKKRCWNVLRVCGPLTQRLPRQRKKSCRKEKGGLEVSSTLGHPEVYGVFIIPLSHKHRPYFRTISASSPQKGKMRKQEVGVWKRGRSLNEPCTLFSPRASEFAGWVSDAGWQQTKQVNNTQTQ